MHAREHYQTIKKEKGTPLSNTTAYIYIYIYVATALSVIHIFAENSVFPNFIAKMAKLRESKLTFSFFPGSPSCAPFGGKLRFAENPLQIRGFGLFLVSKPKHDKLLHLGVFFATFTIQV